MGLVKNIKFVLFEVKKPCCSQRRHTEKKKKTKNTEKFYILFLLDPKSSFLLKLCKGEANLLEFRN